MKLVVKNFGAIKECVIDLSKRHYLFVGYNNTGKTYLGKLIYDIFNAETLREFAASPLSPNHINKDTNLVLLNEEIISSLFDNFAIYLKDIAIPKSLKTNGENQFILKNLKIKFDYTIEEVRNHALRSGTAIGFRNESDDIKIEIYALKKDKNSLEVKIENFTNDDIYQKLPDDFFENIPKKRLDEQINSIKKDASKSLVQSLLTLLLQNKEKPFFLPANRIFILENADELVEQENNRNTELAKSFLELLESKEKVSKEKLRNILAHQSESNHTAPISSLIQDIAKLRKNKDAQFIQNGTGFFEDSLSKLATIMGGEIVMDKQSNVSNWTEKFKINSLGLEQERSIRMYLASSSVNQLGVLFLYFKYWAKSENNFLMIDEPEENLHPENQIRLVNLLLEFAQANNKILITTHSPLLAEVLNNYLVLGQLNSKNKEAAIEKLGLLNLDITPENTGIYYFNGQTVTEHTAGSYGTIFTSFKLAQDKVYATADYLGELMFNQLNQAQ